MVELYSIAGVFDELSGNVTIPFGGFFIRTKNSLLLGTLIDKYGKYKISGGFDPETERLNFKKSYSPEDSPKYTLSYSFSLEKGIWVGEYKSLNGISSGKSFCNSSLVFEDLPIREIDFGRFNGAIIFDSLNLERLVKAK